MGNCNKFWVLQNYDITINPLNKMNKIKSVKFIRTYDSSTIYSNLTYGKLLDVLFQQTDFVFQGGNKTFNRVSAKS